MQKKVTALTRQIAETRVSLARMQDRQRSIDSSGQKIQGTLAIFEQLTQAPKLAGLSEENVAPLEAEEFSPGSNQPPAFPDRPSARPLKTSVVCNEVCNLLGKGQTIAGAAYEAVEKCGEAIGRGGAEEG